jgi:hypothetical protein
MTRECGAYDGSAVGRIGRKIEQVRRTSISGRVVERAEEVKQRGVNFLASAGRDRSPHNNFFSWDRAAQIIVVKRQRHILQVDHAKLHLTWQLQPELTLRKCNGRTLAVGERAIRLSPLDFMKYLPHGMICFANFLRGRHEEAVVSGLRAVQMGGQRVSIAHGWLAAPLAKLGRLDEARAEGVRLLALEPGYTISRWFAAVGIAPHIRDTLADALRLAGLPE